MIHSLKYRADFAVRMDAKGKEILETSRSTAVSYTHLTLPTICSV